MIILTFPAQVRERVQRSNDAQHRTIYADHFLPVAGVVVFKV